MTKRTSFLTRFLALAMAIVMFASASNLGLVLRAFASEGQTVTDGELIASNYALSAEEKALLKSGMLGGASHTYTVLENAESLVTIDAEAKTVSAESKDGWVPASAELMVNGVSVQEIALTEGKGSFTTDELVYAIAVHYALNIDVDVEAQKAMLKAPALLKKGLANLKAGYAADTNLGVVAEAKSVLQNMASEFGAEASSAIAALFAENGIAALQGMNAAYDAAAAKTGYLMGNSAAYQAKTAEVYGYLNAISKDALMSNAAVDEKLAADDAVNNTSNAILWGSFKEILSVLVADLEKVANADWTVPALPENVDYAALDAAVNAIATVSEVEVHSSLLAATSGAMKQSDNAKSVTFKMVLEAVNSENAVAQVAEAVFTLTMHKDATKDDIYTAIQNTTYVADTMTAWDEAYGDWFVHEQFPGADELVGDTLIFTYSPKEYIVTYSYAEAETVPYGTSVELPKHDKETESYDYVVNGVKMAQGSVVIINGDTEITRTSGKAYKTDKLYSIVGKNSGNDLINSILTSGALLGDKTIAVRQPDVADTSALLSLGNNKLKADNYEASYNGLYWTPYSFGNETTTNLFSGNAADWTEVEAKVVYRLWLSGVDGAAIVKLAKDLKADADAQVAALEKLKSYEKDLGELNKSMLGSIIGSVTYTDLTPGDNTDTDAKNLELREYFTTLINGIITNNLTGTSLTIYNMVTEYKNGGLNYYYQNAAAVRKEVLDLRDSLLGLVGDADKEAALGLLLEMNKKPEYAEKIGNLGTAMAQIAEDLTLPNEKIDLNSATLNKLIAALTTKVEGELKVNDVTTPYMESNTLTVKDPTTVNIQVIVEVGSNQNTVSTKSVSRGTEITAAMINGLKAEIDKLLASFVGAEKVGYYNVSTEDGAVEALVGTTLDKDIVLTYEYTPKQFAVKIDGEAVQYITVENLGIKLPGHDSNGYAWEYSIKGETLTARVNDLPFNFEFKDLATLFAGGSFTITRVENDEAKDKFEENMQSDLIEIVYAEDGKTIIGIIANVTANDMMAFATQLMQSGYSHILLNGEKMLYNAEDGATQISVQSLVNALMADAGFDSERIIKLGQTGSGLLLNAKMTLRELEDEELWENIDFTMNMKSVPAQMLTVANGLNAVRNYFSFQSNPAQGYIDVNLNLPDAVYEVYLTALLATNTLDKTDVNAVNHAIAYNFLADYVKLVMENDDVTTTTFENTLDMLIKEFNDLPVGDLPTIDLGQKAEDYYQLVRTALNGPSVDITANENDYTIDVRATEEGINQVLSVLGLSIPDNYKGMIAEIKNGTAITAKAVAVLEDANIDFEAIVIDLARRGAATKTLQRIYDFTDNLPKRVAELKGETAIMLLDDVTGDLNITQSGIIDLNGKTITGDLNFSGRKLVVTDSSLNTVSGGGIKGNVTGDVVILAGTYTADVSANLRDGYYQDGGAVKNALYNYVNGNIVVDTDKLFDEAYVTGYLPAVHYMAADIAFNFIMNYYTASSLTIEGNELYAISFDDLVGILGTETNSGKLANLVDDLLAMIRFDGGAAGGNQGIDGFVNMLVADLLDFDKMYEAVKNGNPIGDYTVTTGAWNAEVKHVAAEDYITVGLVPNMEKANKTTMSLSFEGSNKDRTLRYISELAKIVVVGENDTHFVVDLDQPYRDGKTLVLEGGVDAGISLDFSHDSNYNRILAGLLAYFNEDLTETLVKDGCILELNEVMSEVTMGQVVDVIEKAVNNFDDKYGDKVDFAIIANRLNLNLSQRRINSINNLYDRFINIVGRAFVRFDLSKYSDFTLENLFNDGEAALDVDSQRDYNADAYFRSYGVDVTLKPSKLVLKIKMSCECDVLWGDVNKDGRVNAMDASLILQYSIGLITGNDVYTRMHLHRGDVNGDGMYDAMDASLILQRSIALIDKFPVE